MHCLSIWYLVPGKILPQLIIQMFKSLLFSTWKYTLWSALGTVVYTTFALGAVPLRLSNPPSTAAYETGTPPATELSSTHSSSSSYHIYGLTCLYTLTKYNLLPQESSPVPAIISHQEPEPQAPGPKPTNSSSMGPPPVPPHNYANLPSGQQQQGHAGARPRPSNPLYGKREDFPSYTERREPESVYGPRGSYEAETLRSDSKMMLPPSYTLVADQHSGDSGQFNQFESGQYNPPRPPVAQSPRESVSDNQSDRYAQIQDYTPQMENRYYQEQQPPQMNGHHNGYPEPKSRENDSGIHSMEPSSEPQQAQALKRVPNGHAARDRASLRLKQRKEMEAKAAAGRAAKLNGGSNVPTYVNSTNVRNEDDYGFSGKPLQNGRPANGYADMSGGGKQQAEVDDKWYLKDSMRPVGASNHGMNCKCYRCQRKLTAI